MKKRDKRILLSLIAAILLFLSNYFLDVPRENNVPSKAIEKEQVTFLDHVDGDTSWFMVDGERKKVRYLAIDTQETVHPTKEATELGYSASKYVQETLENAKDIELEFDPASKKEDKYERLLAWVWVDGKLLQQELVQQGLAEIKYVYGDYMYLDELNIAQEEAKENKIGIWDNK